MVNDQPTYYEILGVEAEATAEDIKAAYRAAAKSAHPDHGGTAHHCPRSIVARCRVRSSSAG